MRDVFKPGRGRQQGSGAGISLEARLGRTETPSVPPEIRWLVTCVVAVGAACAIVAAVAWFWPV